MRLMLAAAAVLAAAAALAVAVLTEGQPLGAVLFRWNVSFLNGMQAAIQRYLSPELWNFAVLPVLERPAWLVPAVLAVLLALPLILRRLMPRRR